MKRRLIALAVPLVLAITAACGGGGSSAADVGQVGPGPNDSPSTTAPVKGVYPLTGMPAVNPANAARRAITVKIDNNAQARPQAGLDRADVIYEEFTEGITRFVVVFQSSDAAMIGPVRSVRPGDPNIVKPLGGTLAFSGGSPAVLDVVKASGIPFITENDKDTLRRRSGRKAPHNLYTDTASLYKKAGAGSPPPVFSTFLAPGSPPTAAGATAATRISLSPAPGVSATYQWDPAGGVWKRSTDGAPHALEGGGQISPRNVIVQYTPYANFPEDQKVKYPQTVGSGDAVVFIGGMQMKAKWSKPSATSVTAFTDTAGKPLALAPGQTWVHLQPTGSLVTAS